MPWPVEASSCTSVAHTSLRRATICLTCILPLRLILRMQTIEATLSREPISVLLAQIMGYLVGTGLLIILRIYSVFAPYDLMIPHSALLSTRDRSKIFQKLCLQVLVIAPR